MDGPDSLSSLHVGSGSYVPESRGFDRQVLIDHGFEELTRLDDDQLQRLSVALIEAELFEDG